MSISPHRLAIASCCGIIATAALYAANPQNPPNLSRVGVGTATKKPLALPAAHAASAVDPKPVPKAIRRVILSHDRPSQVIMSWDGDDLRIDVRDATASNPPAKGVPQS